MIPLVVIIVVIILSLLVWSYNSLAKMGNVVRSAWSDIDVQLKRRANLVPNLVETAQGFSGFEQSVLVEVTRARSETTVQDLSPAARAGTERKLSERITRLLAVVEQYPELKSSAHYLRLQNELSDTENKIANARRYYNAAVRDYNTLVESFPTGTVGAAFAFQIAEFFELEDEEERSVPSAG